MLGDDEMDVQSVFNVVAGSFLAALGWFASELWSAIKNLREEFHKVEVDLPKNYVLKFDLDKRMDHIEDMFQRIYNKLDAKADK